MTHETESETAKFIDQMSQRKLSRFKIYKSDDIVVSTRFKFEHENKVQEREKSTLNYANFLST